MREYFHIGHNHFRQAYQTSTQAAIPDSNGQGILNRKQLWFHNCYEILSKQTILVSNLL